MKNNIFAGILAIAAILVSGVCNAAPSQQKIASPDGRISAVVSYSDGLSYTLCHDGEQLICPSPISLTLQDGTVYGAPGAPRKVYRRSVDRTIRTTAYNKAEVRDAYNELTLVYKRYMVVFRAYDDGLAYRFVSLSKTPFKVVSERASFNMAGDFGAYIPYVRGGARSFEEQFVNSFENTYTYSAVSEWRDSVLAFLPVLFEAPHGRKVCITESDLTGYPGMYLYNGDGGCGVSGVFARVPKGVHQGGYNQLQGVFEQREDYLAEMPVGGRLPWRVIAVSTEDTQLACSDFVYRLAPDPDPKADFGWVKPGKVAWDWWNAWNVYNVDFESGINQQTYKYYIDFASSKGIEYVILDEGWSVNLKADLMRVVPELDLPELVQYASERGVGLILWAGYWAFDRDMENVCRHYSQMGIKGFKVDFMNRDDAPMTAFHERAAQMTAKYGLLLDLHGTYKPTGLSRTYPNVLNNEGVHGLEQMKWAAPSVDQVTYDVTVPYIRMMAGRMDYTQGAMRNASRNNYRPVNSEPMSQGTRCHQLAEYVVFDSPLNMLCDSPSNYLREPECTEFIASVPVVWDESRGLDGKVGGYICMARRSGDDWYVAALGGWGERRLTLDLSFLPQGNYTVDFFADGPNASKAAVDYVHGTASLGSERSLQVKLAPGGGYVARISPAGM